MVGQRNDWILEIEIPIYQLLTETRKVKKGSIEQMEKVPFDAEDNQQIAPGTNDDAPVPAGPD